MNKIASLFLISLCCILFFSEAKVFAYQDTDVPIFVSVQGKGQEGLLNQPMVSSFDNQGNIYVADRGNHQIQKYDANGNFLLKFGSQGSGDGQFSYPTGITLDSSGNIYITDSGNRRVQKFSTTGTFLLKFGSAGWGDGQFLDPTGIAIDSNGNIYVTDSSKHDVQKFDSMGSFLANFGSGWTNPFDVSIDSSGNIFISDGYQWANNVKKYDSAGALLLTFGSYGNTDGKFNNVYGISTDSAGNIYTVDTTTSRIQKFDSSGVFVSKFGVQGTADSELWFPHGIKVDSTGRLVIVDRYGFKFFDAAGNLLSVKGNNLFNMPYAVTFDQSNNYYVADMGNNKIYKFNPSGEKVLEFGGTGSGNGQFSSAYDIEVDVQGNIFVLDRNECTLQKFDSSGTFLFKFGSYGTGNSQLYYPQAFEVDAIGNIYISDTYNNKIKKFDATGSFLSSYGTTQGHADGQFDYPNGIAFDSFGNIFVIDSTPRIQKFDSSFNFVSKFGSYGTGDGQTLYGFGITIDKDNKIYVIDPDGDRIQKFDENGVFKMKFGTNGVAPAQFDYPTSLAINNSGDIFVTQTYGVRVQRFMLDVLAPNISVGSIIEGNLQGIANDAASSLTTIEFQVDAMGQWTPCVADDGLIDELSETYSCTVGILPDGHHSISVRATDSYTNTTADSSYGNISLDIDTTSPQIRITDIGLISNVPDKSPLFYYFTSQKPKIKGITEPSSTVHFLINTIEVMVTADSMGNFQVELPELPRELVSIQYYSQDLASLKSITKELKLLIGEENFPQTNVEQGGDVKLETVSKDDTMPSPTVLPDEQVLTTLLVVDENQNLIENATVIIDGQEYKTNSKGIVVLEAKPREGAEITIKINDVMYKGVILGQNIQIQRTVPSRDDNSRWSTYLWALLFVTVGVGVFRTHKWYKRKLKKSSKSVTE